MESGQGKWAMFRKPQPLLVSEKVRQYTSNLYGSTSPICIAVFSWLLSFEKKETLQYASHLYCSTPPICTAVRPPFVRQYFWKNTGGWGHQNVSEQMRFIKYPGSVWTDRGTLDRYTKRLLRDSAIILMGESAFYCANHRVFFKCQHPQGGKFTDFSAGKCHLLYVIVVPESLNRRNLVNSVFSSFFLGNKRCSRAA